MTNSTPVGTIGSSLRLAERRASFSSFKKFCLITSTWQRGSITIFSSATTLFMMNATSSSPRFDHDTPKFGKVWDVDGND